MEKTDNYEEKLKTYMQDQEIKGKLVRFSSSVATADLSSKLLEKDVDAKFIKTVLFTDKQNGLYAVILDCDDKVDNKKLKKEVGKGKLKLVPFSEVESRIGYPAGGVPPFGYQATFLLDTPLELSNTVYAGGGSEYALVKTTIHEIVKATKPKRCDMRV